MELSPILYHRLVRPKTLTELYIYKNLNRYFSFQDKKVLDFGCGVGANCPLFHAAQYFGIDPDPRRIFYARKLYPQYRFGILDGTHLPLPNQSVDYILIVAVLHHIPHDQTPAYLEEFRRILKTGGRVLVMEPCYDQTTRFRNWFMSTFDKGKFIRDEPGYLSLFGEKQFKTQKHRRFKKMFLYNELFFSAIPLSES